MKSFSRLLVVFTLLLCGVNTLKAQSSLKDDEANKAAEVKNLVNSKDFVFEATNKGSVPLGYHKYDVAIAKDTLIAELSSGRVPVKFDCTHFDYKTWRGKNGNWEVVIKPDTRMTDVKQMKMEITPMGHAMLQVVRGNGNPLSFAGYIKQEDY